MTARSHTRSMHKAKKRAHVAHLRWRLSRPRLGHKAGKGQQRQQVSPAQHRRQEQMDMMEKGNRYTDDY